MLIIDNIPLDLPALYEHEWPPVNSFSCIDERLGSFLKFSTEEQKAHLTVIRNHSEVHGEFLNNALNLIYSYVFGYKDSPLFLKIDEELEIDIYRTKINLEQEMLENFLQPALISAELSNLNDTFCYLESLVANNAGVEHPFFDFISQTATREILEDFMRLEVIRNEIVDDEVAFMCIGLQGVLKKVVVSNLWDECGNSLKEFHTYWLRRLLNQTNEWDYIKNWRARNTPWFSKISANSFNMLLTRPGFVYRRYGSFCITEGWVMPHFERIILGLTRVGLGHPDIMLYFKRHVKIDPHHTKELLVGLKCQKPAMSLKELQEVVMGAHMAIAAGKKMYDKLYNYFSQRL